MLGMSQSARLRAVWVEGVHEKSVWTGSKIKGRAIYHADTWRGRACGALRSYATERKR